MLRAAIVSWCLTLTGLIFLFSIHSQTPSLSIESVALTACLARRHSIIYEYYSRCFCPELLEYSLKEKTLLGQDLAKYLAEIFCLALAVCCCFKLSWNVFLSGGTSTLHFARDPTICIFLPTIYLTLWPACSINISGPCSNFLFLLLCEAHKWRPQEFRPCLF